MTILTPCNCTVVPAETVNCATPLSSRILQPTRTGTTPTQPLVQTRSFTGGTASAGLTINVTQNWGGYQFGMPNSNAVWGLGSRFARANLVSFGVDVSTGVISIPRFKLGLAAFNYDGAHDIDLTFAVRSLKTIQPTITTNRQANLDDSTSYGVYHTKLSLLHGMVNSTDGYVTIEFANRRPIYVPAATAAAPADQMFFITVDKHFEYDDYSTEHALTSSFIAPRVWNTTTVTSNSPTGLFLWGEIPQQRVGAEVWIGITAANGRTYDMVVSVDTCATTQACTAASRGCDGVCYSLTTIGCNGCKPTSALGSFDACEVCSGGDTGVARNACLECCFAPTNATLANCTTPGLLRGGQCVVDPCFGIPTSHTATQMLACLRAEPFNRKVWREGIRFMYAQLALPTSPAIPALMHPQNPHAPGGYDIAARVLSMYDDVYPTRLDADLAVRKVMRDIRGGSHDEWFADDLASSHYTRNRLLTYSMPILFTSFDAHAGDPATDQYVIIDRHRSCRVPASTDCTASTSAFSAYRFAFRDANPQLGPLALPEDYLGYRVVAVNGRTDVLDYLTEVAAGFDTSFSDSTAVSQMFTSASTVNARQLIANLDPTFDVRAPGYTFTLRHPTTNATVSGINYPFVASVAPPANHASVRHHYVSDFYKRHFPHLRNLDDLGALFEQLNADGEIGWLRYASDTGILDARRSIAPAPVHAEAHDTRAAPSEVTAGHLDMGLFARDSPTEYAALLRSMGVDIADADDLDGSGWSAEDWFSGRASLPQYREMAERTYADARATRAVTDMTFYAVVPSTATTVGYYRSDVHRWVVLRLQGSFGASAIVEAAVRQSAQVIIDAAVFLTENRDYRAMIDVTQGGGGLSHLGDYVLAVFDPDGARYANYVDGVKRTGWASQDIGFQAFVESDFQRWVMRTIDAQMGDFALRDSRAWPGVPTSSSQQEYLRALDGSNPTVSYSAPGEGGSSEFYTDVDVRGSGAPLKGWGGYTNTGIDPTVAFVVPPPNRRSYKRGELVILASPRTISASAYFTTHAYLWGTPTIVHLGGLKSARASEPHPMVGANLGGAGGDQGADGSFIARVYGPNVLWDMNIMYGVSNELNMSLPEPETYNVFPWTWSNRLKLSREWLAQMSEGALHGVNTAKRARADCVFYQNADFERDDYLYHLQQYANEFEVAEVIEHCQLATRDLCGRLSGGASGLPVNDCVQCNPDGADPTATATATRVGRYTDDGACVAVNPPTTTCDPTAATARVTVWNDGAPSTPWLMVSNRNAVPAAPRIILQSTLQRNDTSTNIASSTTPPNDGGCFNGFPTYNAVVGLATLFNDVSMPGLGLGTAQAPKTLRVSGIRVGIERIIYNGTNMPVRFMLAPLIPAPASGSGVIVQTGVYAVPDIANAIVTVTKTVTELLAMPRDSSGRINITFAPLEVLFDGLGVAAYAEMNPYPSRVFPSTQLLTDFHYGWTQVWFRFHNTTLPGTRLEKRIILTNTTSVTWSAIGTGDVTGNIDMALIAQPCDYDRGCALEDIACDERCFSRASIDLCGACTTPSDADRNACVECVFTEDDGTETAGVYPCGDAAVCACAPDPCRLPRVGRFAQTLECFQRLAYDRTVHETQAAHYVSTMDTQAAEPYLKNAAFSPITQFHGVDIRALVADSLEREFDYDYETHAEFNRITFAMANCHSDYDTPRCYRYNLWGIPVNFHLRYADGDQYVVLDRALNRTMESLFSLQEYREFAGVAFNPAAYLGWRIVELDGNADVLAQITSVAFNVVAQDTPSTQLSMSIAAGMYTSRSGYSGLPTIGSGVTPASIHMKVQSPVDAHTVDLVWPLIAVTRPNPEEQTQDPRSTRDFERRCINTFYRNHGIESYSEAGDFIASNTLRVIDDLDRLERCVSSDKPLTSGGDSVSNDATHFATAFVQECKQMHALAWSKFQSEHKETRNAPSVCNLLFSSRFDDASYWHCPAYNVSIIRIDSYGTSTANSDGTFFASVHDHIKVHNPIVGIDQNGVAGGSPDVAYAFLALIDLQSRRDIYYGPSEYRPRNGIVDQHRADLVRINAYTSAIGLPVGSRSDWFYNRELGYFTQASLANVTRTIVNFESTGENATYYAHLHPSPGASNVATRKKDFLENTPNNANFTFTVVLDPRRVFLITSGFSFSAAGGFARQFTGGKLGQVIGLYQQVDSTSMHCARCALSRFGAPRMPYYTSEICGGVNLPHANRKLMPVAGDAAFSSQFFYHPYGQSYNETAGLEGEQEFAYIPTNCSVWGNVPPFNSVDRQTYIDALVTNLFNPDTSSCGCPPGAPAALCSPRRDDGAACTGNHDCESNHCVHDATSDRSVCCSARCDGVCQSCFVQGHVGVCTVDERCAVGVTDDCDATDPQPCQMTDACGSCGASADGVGASGSGQLVVEGWPPPQGVAVVADTW